MSAIVPDAFKELEGRFGIPYEELADFCRRHQITRLDVFGSVLREDIRPDSDIDLIATFGPGVRFTLFDHMDIERELSRLLGREVDLLTIGAVLAGEDDELREAVLGARVMLYAEPA
jgi:predicted nucleotidyltransferase